MQFIAVQHPEVLFAVTDVAPPPDLVWDYNNCNLFICVSEGTERNRTVISKNKLIRGYTVEVTFELYGKQAQSDGYI